MTVRTATTIHGSPVRSNRPRMNSRDGPSTPVPPNIANRQRINSREIPRSYSGLYGGGGNDLLPFELARNWHTDWLERGGWLLFGT